MPPKRTKQIKRAAAPAPSSHELLSPIGVSSPVASSPQLPSAAAPSAAMPSLTTSFLLKAEGIDIPTLDGLKKAVATAFSEASSLSAASEKIRHEIIEDFVTKLCSSVPKVDTAACMSAIDALTMRQAGLMELMQKEGDKKAAARIQHLEAQVNAMSELINVYREENGRLTTILTSDTILQTTQQELTAANAKVASLEAQLLNAKETITTAEAARGPHPASYALYEMLTGIKVAPASTTSLVGAIGMFDCVTNDPETHESIRFCLDVYEEGDGIMLEYTPDEEKSNLLPAFLQSSIAFEDGQAPMFLAKLTESLRHMTVDEAESEVKGEVEGEIQMSSTPMPQPQSTEAAAALEAQSEPEHVVPQMPTPQPEVAVAEITTSMPPLESVTPMKPAAAVPTTPATALRRSTRRSARKSVGRIVSPDGLVFRSSPGRTGRGTPMKSPPFAFIAAAVDEAMKGAATPAKEDIPQDSTDVKITTATRKRMTRTAFLPSSAAPSDLTGM